VCFREGFARVAIPLSGRDNVEASCREPERQAAGAREYIEASHEPDFTGDNRNPQGSSYWLEL
jgi:hypothetical protein